MPASRIVASVQHNEALTGDDLINGNAIMVTSRKHWSCARAALVCALVGGLLVGCGEKSAEQYISDAKADRAAGKISAAIIDVKNALQKEPKNTSARVLLAQFFLDLPDATSAEAELLRAREDGADAAMVALPLAEAELILGKPQRALKEIEITDATPADLKASLLAARGSALMALGQMNDAQVAFDAAVKADPKSIAALTAITRYALVRGDVNLARERLAVAQKQDPKNPTLFSLEGAIAFAAGDAAASEQAFEKMLGIAPWSLPARVGMARAQIAEKKLKEAEANLDAVLRSAPNDPNTNYLRALAAFREADYSRAQVHIQRTLNGTKDFPPALLLGGSIAYGLKQYEQANALLGQYVYLVPQAVQARKLLATVQVALGHSAEAVKTLTPAVGQGPVDAQLLAMVGEASARSGDLVSARRYLSMAVENLPNDTGLRTQLGLTEISLGQTDQGIEDLEKAGQQDPEALRPEIALFSAHFHNKEFDKALEVAERIQGKHPNEAVGFDLIGLAQLAKGDVDAARTAFLKARELHAGDPMALKVLASLEVRAGNLSGASQYLQEILKANPKDVSAYIGLAQIESQSGHPQETQTILETAIKENPDNPAPRVPLGRFFLVAGKNQDALNVIGPALTTNPRDPALLEISGRAQLALRNTDAAIAAFRTLVEVQPQSATSHRYLAETYGAAGNLDSALSEARKAVEIDPKDTEAKFTLARIYITQKNYADARKVADDLAIQAPQDTSIAELQASIAVADNRLEDAILSYRREIAITDNNFVRARLGQTLAQAGHLADAEATLLPWIQAHPEDATTRLALANIYLGASRFADAQTQYAAVLERNPSNALAENNLAWVMAVSGQPGPALEHARHAATLAPQAAEVLDTLGVILLQNDKTDEAVETLRKAVAANPQGDPEIQFHFAQALVRAGKKDDARQSLRTVLKTARPFTSREQAEKLLAELGS